MKKEEEVNKECPAEQLLKTLGGKWKMHILHSTEGKPKRFSDYMRLIEGTNKQSLSVALRELESDGLLIRQVITEKPIHIEYSLTEKGKLIIPIFDDLYKTLTD
ncbi:MULTISPECIES: winged helix-turn-helix transcriptional regulator [Myroides]|uniref:Transcriptional regulator n=1 Tax=Myroides albus TaxID=2562892 RepID=A0A6I3LKH4_9FLAO|nr:MULTISPECIES: helix-turn-helix domain-containing protein [Myroides]MTG97011.1 transcriptional regulator [Myroides albus]MVX36997.1 transcriptional regulator [Myroides sp. LoEW2-1]